MAGKTKRRFEFPLFRLLPLIIGALVLLAVVPVAVLGYLGARRNTAELGSQNRDYVIQLIIERLSDQFEPVSQQILYIQNAVATGRVTPSDMASFDSFMIGTLAGTPQEVGIGLIRSDGSLHGYGRTSGAFRERPPTERWRTLTTLAVQQPFKRSVDSTIIWSDIVGQPVVEFAAPLWHDDQFYGFIIGPVSVSELSHFLGSLRLSASQVPFIIDDGGGVLAHPALAGDYHWIKPAIDVQPLPRVDKIGDPVLAAFWTAERHKLQLFRPLNGAEGHWAEVGNAQHAFFYRTVPETSGARWLIGFHEPAEASRIERWTVNAIAIAGIAAFALAMAMGVWLSRELRGPVLALEKAAGRAEALDFAALTRLPRSAIAEINAAARAFERMAAGLRWFEAYLPRALVHRLIAIRTDPPTGERRELTVMFIDIRGYTAYAHGRPAEEVGRALNQLFACLGPLIEATGGTIDKYTGDGLMAFWGAPDERPSHALDACATALSFCPAFEAFCTHPASPGIEDWRLRVGIQTGSVIVGNLGFSGRINYTIVGDAVNEAQRLEALGKREIGSARLVILVGEAVYARTASDFLFSEVDHPPAELRAIGRIYRLVDGVREEVANR